MSLQQLRTCSISKEASVHHLFKEVTSVERKVPGKPRTNIKSKMS